VGDGICFVAVKDTGRRMDELDNLLKNKWPSFEMLI